MNLPSNLFNNQTPPQAFLCQPDKTIIGEIQPYDFTAVFKFNTYSETSFTISKTYVDIIDGKMRQNPYYYLMDSLRVIYLSGIGHFVIQDVKENLSVSNTKSITAFSLEYATSTKYLDGFRINTGEDDSLEYVYHIQQYGDNYSIDNPYKKATSDFDPYERYYVKEYTNNTAYVYTEVQIFDKDAFESYDEELYVRAYPNIRFYWPSKPELSLLHLIFSSIPEWKIGHVDRELWYQERTFNEERVSVYDFLHNTAAETFKYIIEWDSINGEANFYMTEEDGVTSENNVQTLWETDVYISQENLAESIDISYSTDDIRTKLKVTGGDGVDIRDVNLGQNYITNLSFYNDEMWLGRDLYIKYNDYIEAVDNYTAQYTELISDWSAAYNEYNELMHHVPVSVDVIRTGDTFKQLYCTYKPTYKEDATQAQIDDAVVAARKSLINKLKLFKVNEDTHQSNSAHGNKADNVLLTLENANSDSATIRVFYDDTISDTDENKFKVSRTITNATSGAISVVDYSLLHWVEGKLSASHMSLDGFTIKAIGTLGAYLCSVRDETKKVNVEDYGIKLLQEKQSVYTKIFIAQTEGYMSKENYQCLASDEEPVGEIDEGTRWLDTDSEHADIYIYDGVTWKRYDAKGNDSDFENYARFHENYQKLQVVQEVLAEKQKQATYLLNGFAVENRRNVDFINLAQVAIDYFGTESIVVTKYMQEFGIVKFRLASDNETEYAVYVSDGVPYISYAHSQGVCLAQMNCLSRWSSMDVYFTPKELVKLSPYLREDEYNDTNFILTGYESEEEQISLKQSLLEEAKKELKKISQPKLSFSITMANIMAIPEFACLKEQFKLGNFVRVKIRDGYVKRARLLEVHINFEDFSDFSCQFGDLVTTKDEISKTADLLQQAVQAGKTVASSSSKWQKGADKASALDKAIAEGLKDAALSVSASSGQNILWNERGILGRKLVEGTNDVYEDEQFMLTNNKLVFTSDNWATSRGVFGTFTVNGQKEWGIMTDAMVGGYIEGSEIKGGTLEIGGDGGTFKVHSDGSVSILDAHGNNSYATKDDFNGAIGWVTEIISDGPTIFTDKSQTSKLSCRVYYQGVDKTSTILSSKFKWIRTSSKSSSDEIWNANHAGVKEVIITHADIANNATIYCKVDIETES
jgi:hypothetical protein